MEEIWKDIPGYEGYYQAGTHGKIRGVDRYITYSDNRETCFKKGKILSCKANKDGRVIVILRNGRTGKTFRVHRLIAMTFLQNNMNGVEVDHIDRNQSNNNLYNLRICNSTENKMNTRKRIKSVSKYKGVSKTTDLEKWRARISVSKIDMLLGHFNCELDAARAYDKAAIKYFGEFAKTNEMLGLY